MFSLLKSLLYYCFRSPQLTYISFIGVLAFAGTWPCSAWSATPGRDFVPSDWNASGSINIDGVSSYTLLDAFGFASDIWILYLDPAHPGQLRADTFDPTSGMYGSLSGAPVVMLTADMTAGSVEADGINSGNMGLCSAKHVASDTLTWDGMKYRTTHIGIRSGSITVSGSGGTCASLAMTANSFVAGYENSGVYKYDGIGLSNKGTCTSFTATYEYTNCGFTGTDAFRCAMIPDPVPDGNAEHGFCRFMLMYEADYDGDADAGTPDDRALLTAHAQHISGPWVRYLPAAAGYPSTGDIRVQNTSEHQNEGAAGIHSFVSVPTLHYDTNANLWRMWFVTEDAGGHSVRYTESDDNGLSWGIGGGAGGTIDCWNGAAFDTTACADIDWTGTAPPNSTVAPDFRNPDIVDPEVIWDNLDGSPGNELGMMFTGGDDACAANDWGVQLWQLHANHGDQSAGTKWVWSSNVAADTTNGVVMDKDRVSTHCSTAGNVMDPELVQYAGGWLGFFNASGGIYVAASGFQCSDFLDNDAGGGTDWPTDMSCTNPWDSSE